MGLYPDERVAQPVSDGAAYARTVDGGAQGWVWPRRVRWKLRGAWQAPAFVLFTLVDAVLLERLPFAGDDGPGWVGAFLLAGFLNLFVVAVVGPLLGLWMRRRNATTPGFAARDRGGVYALAGLSALLLAGGLIHRPAIAGEQRDLSAQVAAARAYFARSAPAAYRARLPEVTTWKAGEDLYRTCLAGPDPSRQLCVYVATDQSPPGVTRDTSQVPNERLAGQGTNVVRVR